MTFETVLYDVADGVATVTLNRPEAMNAWTTVLGDELGLALGCAAADDDVRAVVITGAGRAFCAGADLSGGGFGGTERAKPRVEGERRWPYEVPKPVIAAINGHAIGVGITYPLLADVRIVAQEAKLQFAFVRRGIMPELGSHTLLPRVVGFSRAADLLLTGRLFTGVEAAELGLASRALPAVDVLPAALAMARDIAANVAPVSAAVTKRLLWEGTTTTIGAMRKREDVLFPILAGRADAVEGVAAFLQKRSPVWPSRVSTDLPAEL
jgi:enoyl-CoA hydratase/carnithine racemase